MALQGRTQRPWRDRTSHERGSRLSANRYHSGGTQQQIVPCRYFQNNGFCKFGSNCRFSHDQSRPNGIRALPNPRDTEADDDGQQDVVKYSDWKCLLWKQPRLYETDNVPTLVEIWSGALAVLNGGRREDHQKLAKDLVDDTHSGCRYLILTLKIRLESSNVSELRLVLVEDFLSVITHPSILDCLSIDTYIGTMYSIISGTGGERAVEFFHKLCEDLMRLSGQTSEAYHSERLEKSLRSILDALYELLRREKRVAFHDDLPRLFDELEELLEALDATSATPGQVSGVRAKRGRLELLRRLASLSTNLIGDSGDSQGSGTAILTTAAQSVFPIDLILPDGRHDNDHMDIARIDIFPTASELLSSHDEYLPPTDHRYPHFHNDPVQRYLDTHFRLLRYDIFGPVKEELRKLILSFEGNKPPSRVPSRDMNAHLYHNASISHISVDKMRGFEVHISFSLPHHLRQKSQAEQQRWWERSRRLEPGVLICLLSSTGNRVTPLLFIVSNKREDSSEHRTPSIPATLATLASSNLQLTVELYQNRTHGVLVALPGLIPATFTPILENLQTMIHIGELPFREWIISDTNNRNNQPTRPYPPLYTQHPEFVFPLGSITQDEGSPLSLSSDSSPDDESLIDMLETRTGLDRGQCRALVCALTREFALIQGPPGTGKSFLGVRLIRVLLECKKSASLGPIIVICYTNHALDQFLQHLLDVGISRIIRIGGQSRSAALDGHNLKNVSALIAKTRVENFNLREVFKNLEDARDTAGRRLGSLHKLRKGHSWDLLQGFLERRHPKIHSQLYHTGPTAYTVVREDPLELWVGPEKISEAAPNQQALDLEAIDVLAARAAQNLDSLSYPERRILVDGWLKQIQKDQTDRLFVDIMPSEEHRRQLDAVHNEVNRRALLEADVIGVTTTGLAKHISTLRKLGSKVVICEEAAEVLEAHVISGLMPGVEHFIQIGDHQQLRPQINNYSLSTETSRGMLYQLDRSQFERLATGDPSLPSMPVAQLNVQRRMRPEIASLIRDIYPQLEDHSSVRDMPNVVGIRHNVFWLTHNNTEDTSADDGAHVRSHSNEWEVQMTKALVRHLVRQGAYGSNDIAVLTPYTGQLQKLRAAMSSDFEVSLSDRDEDALAQEDFEIEIDGGKTTQGARFQRKQLIESLRLATVDNFQGEEAKIIIVSLVRSNTEQKVGFLRTKNRINVLLSRAQHGMYLIGNAETYANIPKWADVRARLEARGTVGPAFELCCPRHTDTPIRCAEPDDFLFHSPEGGCTLPCDGRLDSCGHRCQSKCHSAAMHSAFLCPQPCPRIRLSCDHPCPKLCGEDCGPCRVLLDDLQLPCGHHQNGVPCYQAQTLANLKCCEIVEKEVPGCGHLVRVPCPRDISAAHFSCPTPCTHLLKCGHQCPGSCGSCGPDKWRGSVKHKSCKERCRRPNDICGHICPRACHAGVSCNTVCEKRCEVRCVHSRCCLSCRDACPPCIEPCTWSCEHRGACTMPCAAPCNRLPCDERCARELSCGHQCPGLCGEICPDRKYCQICGSLGESRVDLFELKSYADIDLDDTPIVVLSCEHFFTAESLDGLVGLSDVYDNSGGGIYTDLREPSTALLNVPRCPDCKRPVRQFATQRYNRVVNAAVMDETLKKFLLKGQSQLEEIERHIDEQEISLRETRADALAKATRPPELSSWGVTFDYLERLNSLSKRYVKLEELKRKLINLCDSMGIEQQPSKKLFDAVQKANKQHQPLESQLPGLSLEAQVTFYAAEKRVILGGRLADLKIQEIMLGDMFSLVNARHQDDDSEVLSRLHIGEKPDKTAKALLHECKAFVEESEADKFPRLAVLGSLAHVRVMVRLRSFYFRSRPASSTAAVIDDDDDNVEQLREYSVIARALLENAETLCNAQFEGADRLREGISAAHRLLGRESYEPVSAEELASIKSAMVSGPHGIVSHSGHWYKCSNGHQFAVGECGMPVELARCPECGALVGGLHHQLVAGVTRAREMES